MKTILVLLFTLSAVSLMGQIDKKPFTEVDEEEPVNSSPFKIHPKGIKLFGDIYFGMSKQDFRKLISEDKDKQAFEVLGYKIKAHPGLSRYNDNGLYELHMSNSGFNNPGMGENECKMVLIATDSIMAGLGAEVEFKNNYWPNHLAMSGRTAATYFLKGKIIEIWSNDNSYGLVYTFNMDITTEIWRDKLRSEEKKEIKSNLNTAKQKF